ncbi:hypothetical protein AN6813.2 [Aspergillus nidulans FGSC A4]|uniref:Alcohol dehydrogenase-like N-terminal domain-containing protein n=1 Tax=Emericella nidulans (strain FGSC A4 / ATCC 38163 / CBS 112.46 / NRRL 194 / M139) TaxID=227321 RepID=Q5AY17_EMENI|nr:hypothetical protein [Aspergillus nidulans FGSC A4]EAA58212.1 hypothetical protein AN6813.2 [Aspergillus nidulans FGSC A4]CBF71513.1 TPA: conserved hypothetical protein [Aspergillus nidulans FGSC A4]|eukprot:XP_664417.1 hypothetical protein AN6813.2 [Aspergillus nidulans FGSC A4]
MATPQADKQAVSKAAGQSLVIEEGPLMAPGPNEILVKVEACGVCFSDVFAQNNVMGGGFPIAPGHEIVGRVADRKGSCKACRKDWYQMCDSQVINGVTKDGGYAEYCLLNPEAAVRVPAHLSAAKYVPIPCAGVSVSNSIHHMKVPVGETVAIQGLGGLGHLAIQYTNKMGFRPLGGGDEAALGGFGSPWKVVDSICLNTALRFSSGHAATPQTQKRRLPLRSCKDRLSGGRVPSSQSKRGIRINVEEDSQVPGCHYDGMIQHYGHGNEEV